MAETQITQPQALHDASQLLLRSDHQARPQALPVASQHGFPFHLFQSMGTQIPMSMEQTMNIFAFQNKIFDIRNKSCSLSNYAVNLMLFFFTEEELTRPDVNVNGKNSNGNSKVMQPLDPVRINQIRLLCMERF